MHKKLFNFSFKSSEPTTTTSTAATAAPWPWPSCTNSPKTLSFRAPNETTYKNVRSTYDKNEEECFSVLSEVSKTEHPQNEDLILEGLKSDRLFFEPGETSSILTEAKTEDFPYKESAAMLAMDSRDPFVDFRVSMQEMVETHGLKDWDSLEELLGCYLKVNEKNNHGYILGAFVDLLLNLAQPSSVSSNDVSAIDEDSFTSPLSFSSSIDSSTSPSMESVAVKIADGCLSSSSSCTVSSSSGV